MQVKYLSTRCNRSTSKNLFEVLLTNSVFIIYASLAFFNMKIGWISHDAHIVHRRLYYQREFKWFLFFLLVLLVIDVDD